MSGPVIKLSAFGASHCQALRVFEYLSKAQARSFHFGSNIPAEGTSLRDKPKVRG